MKKDLVFNAVQEKILGILFYYRCTTAIQASQFVYDTQEITKSNEKYIYGQLAKLEDLKLVTRFKPIKRVSKYAVFYLTKKGFDFMNDQYVIEDGHVGTGWIGDNDTDFGYFDYSVYNPPLRQLQHHLFLVEILLDTYIADIKHRNNLYASRFVKIPNTASGVTLRPDAEMIINGEVYTIEIDRGTETHEQLYAKFKNYFEYQAEHKTINDRYDIQHIVFVVDANMDGHLQRRWTNMLAAYYKGLRGLANNFHLHLVVKDEFFNFLRLEELRETLDDAIIQDLLIRYDLELIDYTNRADWYECNVTLKDGSPTVMRAKMLTTPYSTRNTLELLSANSNNYFYRTNKEDVFLAAPNKLKAYQVQERYTKLYEDVHQHKAISV